VFPGRYEVGFYMAENTLHGHRLENFKYYNMETGLYNHLSLCVSVSSTPSIVEWLK
jgi:hypothetical protein